MSKTLTPLVLASQSPRRHELLRSLMDHFEIIPSKSEEVVNNEKSPEENVCSLAEQKMRWVEEQNPDRFIIAADTLVALGNVILGKPKDEADACRILRLLSGNDHQVMTGIAAVGPGFDKYVQAEVSTVKFKSLSDDQIKKYVAGGEPMDKAGAYAIQGEGAKLIEFQKGSFSNIVGFPLEIVKPLLTKMGYLGNGI